MAGATINFESANGSIKQWPTGHGDSDNPQYIYPVNTVRAEKAGNKNRDDEEVNVKVAVRDLLSGNLHMDFMNPVDIECDRVRCSTAADFLAWFSGAQQAGGVLPVTATVIATVHDTYVDTDALIGRTVAAIIVNDNPRNTNIDVIVGATPGVLNRLKLTDGSLFNINDIVTIIFA